MTIEERLNQLEARAGKNDELVRTLRDNFEVIASLEGRQSTLLKDHSEWLVAHDKAMAELDKRIANLAIEAREADKHLEKRISELVVAIGEFVRREIA